MINQHPQPVDDCPCFEDAIAFNSVILGFWMGLWSTQHIPALNPVLFTVSMPGAALDSPSAWLAFGSVAVLKLVCGISAIFLWRLLAKAALHAVLPPLFRWLAYASPVRLPRRRHYTPATEYARFPPHNLRAIPSVIDLDLASVLDGLEVPEDVGFASGRNEPLSKAIKRRYSPGAVREKSVEFLEVDECAGSEKVKHYDADGMTCASLYCSLILIALCPVLTKVVVYVGIGLIASIGAPASFEAVGWGVSPY